MKITHRPSLVPQASGPSARPRTAEEAPAEAKAASAPAKVAISPLAKELASRAAEGASDEARVSRIVDLKRAIESGAYEADSRETAKKMLSKGFLDLIV